MQHAKEILDRYFAEMRWRCLSLAADLDRVQRAAGSAEVMASDPRIAELRKAFEILLQTTPNRAEQFLMLFSDLTPPPHHPQHATAKLK